MLPLALIWSLKLYVAKQTGTNLTGPLWLTRESSNHLLGFFINAPNGLFFQVDTRFWDTFQLVEVYKETVAVKIYFLIEKDSKTTNVIL